MIKLALAKDEHPRDRKRRRLVLQIGDYRFRITREEARRLRNGLDRFALDGE